MLYNGHSSSISHWNFAKFWWNVKQLGKLDKGFVFFFSFFFFVVKLSLSYWSYLECMQLLHWKSFWLALTNYFPILDQWRCQNRQMMWVCTLGGTCLTQGKSCPWAQFFKLEPGLRSGLTNIGLHCIVIPSICLMPMFMVHVSSNSWHL
jgi:hypothetical protein